MLFDHNSIHNLLHFNFYNEEKCQWYWTGEVDAIKNHKMDIKNTQSKLKTTHKYLGYNENLIC